MNKITGDKFFDSEAENRHHFVAFAVPSSGQIWKI
jgi:hypothetical protein